MVDQGTRIVRRGIDPQAAAALAQYSPLLQRIYAARGVRSDKQLELELKHLLPFHDMAGIKGAVDILTQALAAQARILIVGDFDADGATSTALAIKALRAMGAKHVDYMVPNRFEFGYGLSKEIVAAARQRQPDLIITVDNGISSVEGVDLANSLGIKVLITDHHLPADKLPDAAAIVNPNQPGCRFQSKHLAGVGVIFYLMSALRSALREQAWFHQTGLAEPKMADYLDLVALGTVADVVPLDYNNRILVHHGLKRIFAGKACAGIHALLDVAGRDPSKVSATDLGFAVGPRLNAAGRLADMSQGIECLLADDYNLASGYARDLDAYNRERKEIEYGMQEQAASLIEDLEIGQGQAGLCLYHPEWHQGVVGILASRIKDRFHRPVIAFADSTSASGEIKGSARSIPGLHMRDALDLVAKKHPRLLQKFGGHAMAAGLTLDKVDFDAFALAFDNIAKDLLSDADLQARLQTDGELSAQELSLQSARDLVAAGPWGQGFPEPEFDGWFKVMRQRLVADKHLKLELAHPQSGEIYDAIMFFADLNLWPNEAQQVRMVYRLGVNTYRDLTSLQLMISHIEPVS